MEGEALDRLGEYATIDGAARAAGITYWQLVGYIRRKQVPTVKLGGKTTLVRLSDVERMSKEATK